MTEPKMMASFYKRPLPTSCVPFNSTQGKELFATAMLEGNLESYFTLAGQFLSQDEPAYCGLGTLCMVLNALEIDPQRTWKGAWRWYSQEMLDCCRPLADVEKVGVTLAEFACLARCNSLRATVTSPRLDSDDAGREASLAKFREDLRTAGRGDSIMAISYSRKTLGQTGDGHFSPVGAYSEKDDMVLIMDVARFKYPSYWISAELAWDSMLPLDKATGLPRGYCMLSPLPESDPSSLSAPLSLTTLTLNKSSWATLSNTLTKLLLFSSKSSSNAEDLIKTITLSLATLPTSPLSSRPSQASTVDSSLLPSIAASRLAWLSASARTPLFPLFLLALFNKKSSLAQLIPLSAKEDLDSMIEEIMLAGGESLSSEVEVLVRQIGALGECCRAEEDAGAACGCVGPKKGNLLKVDEPAPTA